MTRRSLGSSSALCRKRSTACITLSCALAVSLDVASRQSFLLTSGAWRPLSVLRHRGETRTLRKSAEGGPGEATSLDDYRDVAGRHLEQWLLAEGSALDDRTMQALRDVPPEKALAMISGLWSAFAKSRDQEGVSANPLAAGKQLPAVIHFGGASVSMGAALQLHIPPLDLKASARIGQDQKVDIQVEEIQGGGKKNNNKKKNKKKKAPPFSVDTLRLGQQLHGVVKALPDFGGAFLDVGADRDVYTLHDDMAEDTRVGDEMDVWVKMIKDGDRAFVTPMKPKVDLSSLVLGEKLHGVIERLTEFGAFLNVGAASNIFLPVSNAADGPKVGDEIDVWVSHLRNNGNVQVTQTAPKVEMSALVPGEKLRGVIDQLHEFGGAFIDIGAASNVYIAAEDLAAGVNKGDEIDVWVKAIKGDGKVRVTPIAPKVDIRSLAVGDKLHGVIMNLPKFGGAFLDIGAVTNVYIPASDLTEEVKPGTEVDVWVKLIRDDGGVNVVPQALEAHTSQPAV